MTLLLSNQDIDNPQFKTTLVLIRILWELGVDSASYVTYGEMSDMRHRYNAKT